MKILIDADGCPVVDITVNLGRKYNINTIAVKYGGGGHQKASGATIKDREEAMAMLNDLIALTK